MANSTPISCNDFVTATMLEKMTSESNLDPQSDVLGDCAMSDVWTLKWFQVKTFITNSTLQNFQRHSVDDEFDGVRLAKGTT